MTFSKEYFAKLLTDMGLAASNATVCENAGEYTLTLSAELWELRQVPLAGCVSTQPTFSGDWRLAGDQIRFRWNSFRGCSLTSVYAWKLVGASLSLAMVDDDCLPRIVMLKSLPWVRQGGK